MAKRTFDLGTSQRDYTNEELDFMRVVDTYRRTYNQFLTVTEYLHIFREYQKRKEGTPPTPIPSIWGQKNSRRTYDLATSQRDYSFQELGFLKVVDSYRRKYDKEVLATVEYLHLAQEYLRHDPGTDPMPTPTPPPSMQPKPPKSHGRSPKQ